MGDSYLKLVEKHRASISDYLTQYLKHRQASSLIGEFLDSEGCQLPQHGLGGSSFLIGLKRKLGISGAAIDMAESKLSSGLEKDAAGRDDQERKLLKDILKISAKAALLPLAIDKKILLNKHLKPLFERGITNDLFRPVIGDSASGGNVLVSCYVLQMLYFSDYDPTRPMKQALDRVALKLGLELRASEKDIIEQLYVSSTLCMYDYAKYAGQHRTLVAKLFRSDDDWTKSLSASPPFIDSWYSDEFGDRNRYLRVSKGYIVLSSIYLLTGKEKYFFRFGPVQLIFSQILSPYNEFTKDQRTRSAVYYLFFLSVMLHPEKFFKENKAGFISRWRLYASFYLNNLTAVGWLVTLATAISGAFTLWFGFWTIADMMVFHVEKNSTANFVTAFSVFITGVLGLMRTRRK